MSCQDTAGPQRKQRSRQESRQMTTDTHSLDRTSEARRPASDLASARVILPFALLSLGLGVLAPALLLALAAAVAGVMLAGLIVTRVITRPLLVQLRDLKDKTTRLEASTEATLLTLASAIDARDRYTHGHSVRVAAYSEKLALAAGLSPGDLDIVRRACLVHDIGKIGVPDVILSKPGRLTPEEVYVMQDHPVIGYEMLRNLPWEPRVLEIVRHHHERWDGRGYPDRLKAEAIPFLARLVAVADTLDAMTCHRPYRPAFAFSAAEAEIIDGAGSQFEPAMVETFKKARQELEALLGNRAGQLSTIPADLEAVLESPD